MFGKGAKKSGDLNAIDTNLQVYTIPKEFYGGGNPVIKFKTVEKNVTENQAKAITKPAAAKVVNKIEVTQKKTAVGFFSNRKLLAITAFGLFLIFVGGASLYYWRALQPPKTDNPVAVKSPDIIPPVQNVPVVVPDVSTTTVATTTEPVVQVPSSTPSLKGGLLEFPSILLGSSADLDRDGLTDAEEELFGTDTGKPDTDADGYEDAVEIYNLYSPTVVAPTRLISTNFAKEYVNPTYNYRVYFPSTWAVGSVDSEYNDVLFSTITGENIEIRVFEKQAGQVFEDWFAEWAKNEQFGSLKDFTTVFKGKGRTRSDGLVYYFEDQKNIYVVVYHVIGAGSVNYREIITMMARSFRLPSESEAVLPEQKIIRDLVPPQDTGSEVQ